MSHSVSRELPTHRQAWKIVPERPIVLIVEDEPFALLYAAQLFQDKGFAVLEAEDARDGLSLLEQHPEVCLLFTDIRLPGELNGIALAVRAKALRPELPLLITSGHARPPSIEASGVGQFLAKPYTAQMLAEALRELLPDDLPTGGPARSTPWS